MRLHYRNTPCVIAFIGTTGTPYSTLSHTLEYDREIKAVPVQSAIERERDFRVICSQINVVLLGQLTVTVHIFIHIITQTQVGRHIDGIIAGITVKVFLQLLFIPDFACILQAEYGVQRITLTVGTYTVRNRCASAIVGQFIGCIGKCSTDTVTHFTDFIRPIEVSFKTVGFKTTHIGGRSLIAQRCGVRHINQHVFADFPEKLRRSFQPVTEQAEVKTDIVILNGFPLTVHTEQLTVCIDIGNLFTSYQSAFILIEVVKLNTIVTVDAALITNRTIRYAQFQIIKDIKILNESLLA